MPYHRVDASYEERVAASIATLRVLLIGLAIVVAIGMGLAAYGIAQAGSAQDSARVIAQHQAALARGVAQAANAKASQAQEIATAVTAERDATILRECRAQNARNVASITELRAIIHHYLRNAKRLPGWQRHQIKTSERANIALIDALVPFQNCQQVLRQSTS